MIPADFSDLDCIRVGDDYYAITSTMQFSPGMTIIHSRDLVNWEIVGNAVPDLSQISEAMTWRQMNRYGLGIWAGTLRYHDGRFYLYFGTPDEGYFMTSAERAEGPWEPLTPLLQERGWDDCSAIWDQQGRAWFVGTCFAQGYKTYLFRMSKDGRSIDRTSARLVNEGNGREASKLIYHDGYYYLVFSEHRDGIGRYVMAKRDRKMTGRFAEHSGCIGVVCEGGKTYVELRHDDRPTRGSELTTGELYLRSTWGLDGQSFFSYSTDGIHFTPFGTYHLSWGFYRGDRIGLYCFSPDQPDATHPRGGYVDATAFHYDWSK